MTTRAHIGTPPDARTWLTAQPFAHRGLHDAARGVPENSMAAFMAAVEHGVGIELDVRLAGDGVAVVFHDATLDRMTAEKGPVERLPSSRLRDIRLQGTAETIHSLADVLAAVAGRVPVLIEVKTGAAHPHHFWAAVRHALEGYGGPVAVMSFDPGVARWFSAHNIPVLRGLVVSTHVKGRGGWITRVPFGKAWLAWRARAQFLAYDLKSLPSRFTRILRRRGYVVLTWTVRCETDRLKAMDAADNVIFEADGYHFDAPEAGG